MPIVTERLVSCHEAYRGSPSSNMSRSETRLGRAVKRTLVRGLTLPPVSAFWSPFLGSKSAAFMFHRLSANGTPSGRYPVELLRKVLQQLRRRHIPILDLEELVRRMMDGERLSGVAVALTFDDCYAEHFERALPVLAEFDAPATMFLSTGFTDRTLWLWWDQIEYLLLGTTLPRVSVSFVGEPSSYDLNTPEARRVAIDDVVARAKLIPDRQLRSGILDLSEAVGVELPSAPPDQYAPLTWDQARIAERFGLRFGPSTVSHPILSRTDDAQARYEIEHSWQRLKTELSSPTPVHCFPNGQEGDFEPRSFELCREQGIVAAVTAIPGYVDAGVLRAAPDNCYMIPRFNAPASRAELTRITSGLEAALDRVRR